MEPYAPPRIAKRRALRPASTAITSGGDDASDHHLFVRDVVESLKLIRVHVGTAKTKTPRRSGRGVGDLLTSRSGSIAGLIEVISRRQFVTLSRVPASVNSV